MSYYSKPGVYVEETLLTGANNVNTADTTFLFVGATPKGRSTTPVRIESWQQFVNEFGDIIVSPSSPMGDKINYTYTETGVDKTIKTRNYLPHSVYSFFQNGGRVAYIQRSFSSIPSSGESASLTVYGSDSVDDPDTHIANLLTGNKAPTAKTGQIGDYYVNTNADVLYGPKTADGWSTASETVANSILSGTVAPVSTLGANGDFYIDTVANDLYGPKTAGAWGSASGDTVLAGTGAPASATGADGDFYVNTATGILYGPKAAGAWPTTGDQLRESTGIVLSGAGAPSDEDTGDVGDWYVDTDTGVLYGPKEPANTWPVTTTSLLTEQDNIAFIVEAKSNGDWGNKLSIVTRADNSGTTASVSGMDPLENPYGFSLQVLMDGVPVETFSNISPDGVAPGTRTAEDLINDQVYGSQYITITYSQTEEFFPGAGSLDYRNLAKSDLAGGVDPGAPEEADLTASLTEAVSKIDGSVIATVSGYLNEKSEYVGVSQPDQEVLDRGDVVYIDDHVNQRTAGQNPGVVDGGYGTYLIGEFQEHTPSASTSASYVAAYAPWIIVANPGRRGSTITIPPAGAVMGVIARTDATRSPFKSPAGIEAVVVNAVGVDTKFGDTDLGLLNNAGINVIRPVVGRGICVMGARTRKKYDVDKYLAARRTLIYVREAIRTSTEFAIFENNDEILWNRLAGVAERVLRPIWLGGGLRGSSAAQAYFIRCDSNINTPASIAAGEVRMDIGLALEYPAEFVIIRLTQFEQGGSNVEIQQAQ